MGGTALPRSPVLRRETFLGKLKLGKKPRCAYKCHNTPLSPEFQGQAQPFGELETGLSVPWTTSFAFCLRAGFRFRPAPGQGWAGELSVTTDSVPEDGQHRDRDTWAGASGACPGGRLGLWHCEVLCSPPRLPWSHLCLTDEGTEVGTLAQGSPSKAGGQRAGPPSRVGVGVQQGPHATPQPLPAPRVKDPMAAGDDCDHIRFFSFSLIEGYISLVMDVQTQQR